MSRTRTIIPPGPFAISLGIGQDDHNGWSATVAIGNRVTKSSVLVVGWGFDDVLPLRPWPAYARTYEAHDSGLDTVYHCLAWCGFYVGIARMVL